MMNVRRGTRHLVAFVLGFVGLITVIALTSYSLSRAAHPASINQAAALTIQSGSTFAGPAGSSLLSSAVQQPEQDQADPLNHTAEARGRIAFASERDGNYEIYIMNPGGGAVIRLTNNTAVDREPAWSPDGTRIVFVSDRDGVGSTEIYVMNADGSNQTRLTNNTSDDGSPVWSPDGSKIAFVSSRSGDNEIYTMNPDGSGVTNISKSAGFDDIDPAWSPNSQRIAFANNRDDNTTYEIYTMAADGSGQTRLTNNAADDTQPAWPSGKIVFTSERDGNPEIYSMNAADGTAQTRLTNNTADDVEPAASTDGTQIVFASTRDFPGGTGGFEIYTMTAAGNGPTRLTFNTDDNDIEPAVEPITSTSVRSRLFVANLDSQQEVPQNFSGATGLGTLLLSADERTATVSLTFSGLTTPETEAHIHTPAPPGVNAAPVFPFPNGTFTNFQITLTPTQVQQLKAGLFYMNVHTTRFPDGEIRGQLGAVAPATQPSAPSTAFALTATGNSLLEFNTSAPNSINRTITITGLQSGETLRGIDIRPANGQLFGLGSTSRLYVINTTTGAATAIGSGPFTPALSGTEFGFDFNPTVDRIRVVSDTGQNLRLNPDTGAVAATDTNLAYAAGDTNAGRPPRAVGAAYTNNFAGATSTTLYDIDSSLDILVSQNPPNEGTLNTVGSLGFDTSDLVGFDIAAGSGVGFASLTAAGANVSGLYTINLSTGATTFLGNIGGTQAIRDIAVGSSAVFQLSQASYTVSEGAGRLTITVNRTGDISGDSEVDYETSDGTASERRDYTTASGVLRFESGERSKSFDIFITDDAYVEENETFMISLGNATGAVLGNTNTVTVTIVDNDPGAATPSSTVRMASGAAPSDIQAAADQFRNDLGGANNGVGGSSAAGRREINWDGVPDSFSAPNNLPANFFNSNSARGVVFSTPGDAAGAFQLSARAGNPTNTPVEFGNLNATYPGIFRAFSPERLFTALSGSGNVTDVTFFIPGTSTPATVSGFGAVFTDVDLANTTRIQYFDTSNTQFFEQNVPAATGNETLSFAGVSFSNRRIARVRITSGSSNVGPNDGTSGRDVVVMDDFIYGEPQAVPASGNPIDSTPFFVRQQYVDFLNREPEPGGFNAWVSVLNRCSDVNNNPACDRIEVSASFFRSPEFQEKGFFVTRFYRASFGRLPTYREFVRDLGRINGRTDEEVIANRFAFIDEFTKRAEFVERYAALSNEAFVDTLLRTAGITVSNRDQLVQDLVRGEALRSEVLTEVVENPQFADQEFNRAFVLSQYFGYLRRDPEEAGFNAWLAVLNRNRNDFRTMVNGFLNSREYRLRFGPQP